MKAIFALTAATAIQSAGWRISTEMTCRNPGKPAMCGLSAFQGLRNLDRETVGFRSKSKVFSNRDFASQEWVT
jgi:hypothetical protein